MNLRNPRSVSENTSQNSKKGLAGKMTGECSTVAAILLPVGSYMQIFLASQHTGDRIRCSAKKLPFTERHSQTTTTVR